MYVKYELDICDRCDHHKRIRQFRIALFAELKKKHDNWHGTDSKDIFEKGVQQFAKQFEVKCISFYNAEESNELVLCEKHFIEYFEELKKGFE